MKFKIRTKIILLGASLSFILMLVAFILSFNIYRDRLKSDLNQSVQESLNNLKADFNDDLKNDLKAIKDIVQPIYDSDPDEPEFEDLQDRLNYYQNKYDAFYVKEGTLGMSYDKLNNKTRYLNISGMLSQMVINSDGKIAYITYKDEARNREIILVDFQYQLNNDVGTSSRILGSYFAARDEDNNESPISINYYKKLDIILDGNLIGTVYLEYDEHLVENNLEYFFKTEIIALGIAVVILVIVYAVLAHLTVVKNITKLHKATEQFTVSLQEGNIKKIEIDVKSKDELGELGKKISLMEDEMIDYTNRLALDAKEKMRINTELNLASQIQLATLPSPSFKIANLSLQALIKPAKAVGGDFYDYFYLDDDHLAFVISDVSGKGISAALFMMRAKELIRNKLLAKLSLKNACFEVNNNLLINNEAGLFITSFIGILNLKTLELKYVNAGHEKPYLIKNGVVKKLDCQANFVLGGLEDFEYQEEKIKLETNDRLFMFTDGLNEAINIEKEEFGYQRIEQILLENKDNDIDIVLKKLDNGLQEFTKDLDAFDDVTMVILELEKNNLKFSYHGPKLDVIDEIMEKVNSKYGFIDKKRLSEIGIILDEILNNAISYENVGNLQLNLSIEILDNNLKIILETDGNEFNPLENDDKYITGVDDELSVGGFGIKLVKNLSDDIKYERLNNHNILTIIKHL